MRHHSASFMNIDVLQCVQSHSLLLHRLPSLSASELPSEASNLIQFFLAGLRGPSPRASDLLQLLIDLIRVETQDFLQDLVDTDEALNRSGDEGRPPLLLKESGETEEGPKGPSKNEEVPIAELILSSHAVLLLHTLTVVVMEQEQQQSDSANTSAVVAVGTRGKTLSRSNSTTAAAAEKNNGSSEVAYEFVLTDVRPRLPRSSWWLCIRILKAFMALQLQVFQWLFHFC